MKCNYKNANNIAPWVREAAIEEGRRQAIEQSHDIRSRVMNEVWIAMSLAGLSAKTINRVRKLYWGEVIQKTEDMRESDCGDDWCRDYLVSRDLPYEQCERRL